MHVLSTIASVATPRKQANKNLCAECLADFFLLSLLPQEIKDWCSNARSKWNYTRLCWKHICNQSSTLSVSLHDVKRFKACVGKKIIISDHLLNESLSKLP